MAIDLPCNADGLCMSCNSTPSPTETLLCNTCATPWHPPCLSSPPPSMAAAANWTCPDCDPNITTAAAPVAGGGSDLVAAIRAIEADDSLSDREKAVRRQKLLSGGKEFEGDEGDEEDEDREEVEVVKGKGNVLAMLDEKFNCAICMQLPERPVTTPCGHNFCLKCFQKWIGQSKYTCAKCRSAIPSKMASQPRINAALVAVIRMAKASKSVVGGSSTVFHFVRNENRPEKAFTTERAKRNGKANACSGQIFVTVPPDHFGPINADNDPKRNMGVLVGETWEDRLECRQWGVHLPHVAGIAGQSDYGAQSVALSGGYEDDEDHGEWFLYTGSGGRDLSGNKRTNKEQSFDQKFEKYNQALRVSCLNGYPVRVVRSHKEKRSSYAPESGVRYDGVYRIEKCWRKVGIQGYKVCRYLFVRCDNEPAPWTSDEDGDRPRPLPAIRELLDATDITERTETPSWDYKDGQGWKWVKPPPVSRKPVNNVHFDDSITFRKARIAQGISVKERLLKEFSCTICHEVMNLPLTTPCGHNFCKSCLLDSFADKSFVRERGGAGVRTLRAQKIVKNCPVCPTDISDFVQNPQVNREMNELIETLQQEIKDERQKVKDDSDAVEKPDNLEKNDLNDDIEVTAEAAEVVKLSEKESDICKTKLENGSRSSVDEVVKPSEEESDICKSTLENVSRASAAEVVNPSEEESDICKTKLENGSRSSVDEVVKSSEEESDICKSTLENVSRASAAEVVNPSEEESDICKSKLENGSRTPDNVASMEKEKIDVTCTSDLASGSDSQSSLKRKNSETPPEGKKAKNENSH